MEKCKRAPQVKKLMFFYTINSNLYLSKALLRGKDWKWCQCQRLICLFVCFLKKCNNDTNNVQSSFFFLFTIFPDYTALSFVFINWCYSNSLHWLFHFPIAIRTKWHHKWKKRGGQFKWNNQGDWFPVITSQTTGNGLCMEKCKMAHKWRRDFQS